MGRTPGVSNLERPVRLLTYWDWGSLEAQERISSLRDQIFFVFDKRQDFKVMNYRYAVLAACNKSTETFRFTREGYKVPASWSELN